MPCAAGFVEGSHVPEHLYWSLQNSVKQFCPEIQVKARIIVLPLQSLPMSNMLESSF